MSKIMVGPNGAKSDQAYGEFFDRMKFEAAKPTAVTTSAQIETCKHMDQVYNFLNIFTHILDTRALAHDISKLNSPEKEIFDVYTEKLRGLTYGSDEYKACLAGMKPALDHHYAENTHHPEHFENGIFDMSLLDVCEMFFDWWAATKRHADGDILKSIQINEKRFQINPQLSEIFRNTVDELRRLYPSDF